jgi:hypothetical protein
MRTRLLGILLLSAALVLGAACGDDDDEDATDNTSAQTTLEGGAPETSAAASGATFRAGLVGGGAEVPNPGDPDGGGNAEIRLDEGANEVCYTITVENIAEPVASHIHEAPAQEAGPIVVTFDPEKIGQGEDCVSAPADVIARIKANPRGFYVNVHTGDFPGGAVRGNLDTT